MVTLLQRVFFKQDVSELSYALIGKLFSFITKGFDFLKVEVSLPATGIGNCEFAVYHLKLLVLLEQIIVAFLQFDCKSGQGGSFSPAVRHGSVPHEGLLKTEIWDEWLWDLLALEFHLCFQVLVTFFLQIFRVGTPENEPTIRPEPRIC